MPRRRPSGAGARRGSAKRATESSLSGTGEVRLAAQSRSSTTRQDLALSAYRVARYHPYGYRTAPLDRISGHRVFFESSLMSVEPERQRAHFDTDARRGVLGAGGIVECDMWHAVRPGQVAVVGLEDQRLLPAHVRIPMPSVLGRMRDHDSLERPFRLAGRVKYGICCNQVTCRQAAGITHSERYVLRGSGNCSPNVVVRETGEPAACGSSALCENPGGSIADVHMREARRPGIVVYTRHRQ